MIDKNGKLFGKINLVDLIIVLIIIALAAFVAMKFLGNKNDGSNLTQIEMSFYSDEEPQFVVDALKEGASVYDYNEKVTIGTLESFETGAPISFLTTGEGTIPVEKEGYKSVTLKVKAMAEMGPNGATIDGVLYGVGHTLVIFAGDAKFYLKISAIDAPLQ